MTSRKLWDFGDLVYHPLEVTIVRFQMFVIQLRWANKSLLPIWMHKHLIPLVEATQKRNLWNDPEAAFLKSALKNHVTINLGLRIQSQDYKLSYLNLRSWFRLTKHLKIGQREIWGKPYKGWPIIQALVGSTYFVILMIQLCIIPVRTESTVNIINITLSLIYFLRRGASFRCTTDKHVLSSWPEKDTISMIRELDAKSSSP